MNLENYIEFFELSFNNSPLVVLLIDPLSKKIMDCNKSGLEFYGYSKEEITNLLISDINILPTDIVRDRMLNVLEEKYNQFDFIHRTKQKKYINVHANVSKISLDNKTYLLSIINEIEKPTNFSLGEKEYYLLNTIINSTNTGIMLIEKESHIIKYVNNTALSLMKANESDVIGIKCHRYVCPAQENCCPITEFCQKIQNDEKVLIQSDGNAIPILKSVNTLTLNNIEYLVESFVDISERKELEKKILDAETRWRHAIDGTGAGLWDWNMKTDDVYISSSWKSMLGYDDDEIQNKLSEWESRVHPDDLAYAVEEINKHLNGENEVYSSEHRMLCKNGTYKWVHDKGKIIERDTDGKPTRMIGMHFDIDKLKNVETELKRNEEKYKALFQSLPVGITLSDKDGNILEANSIANELLGVTKEQIEKRKIDGTEWKIVRPDGTDMPPEEFASVRALKEHQTIKNVEMGVLRSKDDFVWLNVNATPINNGVIVSFEDITERLNAQKLLSESESNFRTFFESMDDIIVIADLNGFLITHNKALTSKLGYSSEEVIGKHILDLHQREKAEEATQILNDMFAGICDYCPLPLRKNDDSLLPVETRVWMGTWNGQQCLYGISKDTSKQQLALEKFERLFKNNPAIMALSNLDKGSYININDSFTSILGYTKKEVLGKKATDLGIFKNLDQRAKVLRKILKYGRFSNEVVEVLDKFGNTKYGNFSGEIIDNQGEKTLLTVMIDVTEEINQRQEIESFFSVSLDLLCITNMDLKLLKINNAWTDFLHLPNEQIIGSYLPTYVYRDDIKATYDALQVLQNGESLLSFVNRLHSEVIGGERYFEWRAIPVDGKIFAAGRDITDRIIKEVEINELLKQVIESKELVEASLYQKNSLIEELEVSSKKLELSIEEKNNLIKELERTKELLELSIEEKDKFFSIIAHDLKSPFSGFLGLTKILSEDIFDLSMREMQDFAHSLKLSADNLYKLLENLLEWSRVKRGLVRFQPETIKLNEIFKINLEIINSKALLKNITVENNIKDYIQVSADENMLNAIIRNLISNALKFTPHNGRVSIDAFADEQKVLVSIQDNGIGMPPEIQQKLFTIGEKISRPGTDGEPSTGLGLALCKEYIEKHHCKIWAESKVNQGTTFYFTLKIK